MLESTVRTESLRAGKPVAVGSLTLLPVERVVLHAARLAASAWFAADKQPYALIVRDSGGVKVIATGAVAVTLESLRAQIPGLDDALAAL